MSINIQPDIKQLEIKHKNSNSKENADVMGISRNNIKISYTKDTMTDEELEKQFMKAVKVFEGKIYLFKITLLFLLKNDWF